jgi:hypothetical protein
MSSRALTIAGYIAAVLALALLEALSSFRRSGVPPFRVVVDRVIRTRSGRIGLLAAWAWLGLHFFAR